MPTQLTIAPAGSEVRCTPQCAHANPTNAHHCRCVCRGVNHGTGLSPARSARSVRRRPRRVSLTVAPSVVDAQLSLFEVAGVAS